MLLKRASKFSLFTLLIMLLMTIDASRASACSCAGGLPLIDHVTNSSAIFSGRVTQLSLEEGPAVSLGPDVPAPRMQVYQASVEVSQVWKGAVGQPLSVNTEVDSSACGFPFQVDTEYLIYAYEYEGQLYASLCSNTKTLEAAGSEIAILDDLFSPVPFDSLAPAATVTAAGHGVYYATADQLEVRLLFREGRQEDAPVEELQQQMVDLLTAHGAAEMLAAGRYHLGQDGFYFTVQQEELLNGDYGVALELLRDIESALQQENEAGLENMEVRFSLRDCTQAAVGARFRAMNDARTRAELLAAQAGGQRGAIVAIFEASNEPAPEGAAGLCYDTPAQWHPIPLDSDLNASQQMIWRASLSITFAIEEARTGEAPTTSIVPVPTRASAPVSPLPTPTGE